MTDAPGEVDAFLAALEPSVAAPLRRIVEVARATVPGLGQGRSYGMPALTHRGKAVLGFGVRGSHVSVAPFSGTAIAAAGAPLAGLDVTKGSVRLPLGEGMPDDAVVALLAARVAEVEAALR
ncbi:MAG: DUF1801 domain-containing protein [Kineosporiaceae bacterium]